MIEKFPQTRLELRVQLGPNTRLPSLIPRLIRVLQILLDRSRFLRTDGSHRSLREIPVSRATEWMLRPSPKIQPRIFIAVSISNTCSSSVPKAHGR